MSLIATTNDFIARSPRAVSAVIRAIVRTHKVLREDPSLAGRVGRKLFPAHEAELITELVRRDLPYYTPQITDSFVKGMNAFSRDLGILKGDPAYDDVVASEFRRFW
ncbi:hypothetical protein CDEF62S_05960 [Castellaniella defragrans]